MSVVRFQIDPDLTDEEIFERLLVLRGKVEKHAVHDQKDHNPHKGKWSSIEGLEFVAPTNDLVSARVNGRPIGYIRWFPDAHGSGISGEIDAIWVSERYRRMGIATELFRRAKEINPDLKHSAVMSSDGRPWRESLTKHGGPGPHKGTGTDQSVHGKGGSVSGQGGGEAGDIPDSAAELLAMNDKMEEANKVQYPEDVKQAAADLLQTAIYREAELSPIVQAAAGNAEFKGWDHRIKYTPSIASKITRNMAELERAGLEPTLEEGVRMVSDLNRYTILSDNESFIRNFSSVVDELERAGWESWDHKIKNYFAVRNDSFDGIVSKFRNDQGAILEIQFHTKNSAEIAELSHDLYNIARELPEGDPKRQELAREMVSLWNSSTDHIPEGVFEIGTPSEQLFKHAMHNQKDHGNWAKLSREGKEEWSFRAPHRNDVVSVMTREGEEVIFRVDRQADMFGVEAITPEYLKGTGPELIRYNVWHSMFDAKTAVLLERPGRYS